MAIISVVKRINILPSEAFAALQLWQWRIYLFPEALRTPHAFRLVCDLPLRRSGMPFAEGCIYFSSTLTGAPKQWYASYCVQAAVMCLGSFPKAVWCFPKALAKFGTRPSGILWEFRHTLRVDGLGLEW